LALLLLNIALPRTASPAGSEISGGVCNTAARITKEIESVHILFAAFAGWCAHLSTTGCEGKAARQYETDLIEVGDHPWITRSFGVRES